MDTNEQLNTAGVNHLPLGPEPGDPRAFDPMTAEVTMRLERTRDYGPSLDELARAANLHSDGWTYDTALPQGWVDDVYRKTGFEPVGMGIVWAYGPRGSGFYSGAPFALTREAAVLLEWVSRE